MISLFVAVLSIGLILSGLYLVIKMNTEGDVFKTYKPHRHPHAEPPSDEKHPHH